MRCLRLSRRRFLRTALALLFLLLALRVVSDLIIWQLRDEDPGYAFSFSFNDNYLTETEYVEVFDPGPYRSSDYDSWTESEQYLVDYIADKLLITYAVTNHIANRFLATLTILNRGNRPIPASKWSIHLFHFERIQIDDTVHQHWSLVGLAEQFNISHVDSSLYRLTPTTTFKPIDPGEKREIQLLNGGCMLAKSDIFPNWYVASDVAKPRIIASTRGSDVDFVEAFDTRQNWHCNALPDSLPAGPYTPVDRHEINRVVRPHESLSPFVIPTPVSLELGSHTLNFEQGQWTIVSGKELRNEARVLSKALNIPVKSTRPKTRFILLAVGRVDLPEGNSRLKINEAYSVRMDQHNSAILITGSTPTGVFYGIQTVLSLYDNNNHVVPLAQVTDAPRFGYRGLMLDSARNFIPINEIHRVLESMAMYKLNTLHLHLADDQGWRLQIPGLEELTRIGSRRNHNYTKGLALPPVLGSGPFGNNSGSGFYTVNQYRGILLHAHNLHIKVIPEFDTPGHGQAAILSMEARFRRFRRTNLTAAWEYRLLDPNDTSEYYAPQSVRLTTINPCMNSTYRFVEHVMTAVKAMHQDIMPLEVFHLGGDEVPRRSLTGSPLCEKLRDFSPTELDTTSKLVRYFVWRVSEIAARHSIRLQMWADGAMDDNNEPFDINHFPNDDVTCNIYDTNSDSNRRTAMLVNEGYKVVLSKAKDLYFDHPQEPDPEERGLYWASRFIPTERTFAFQPEQIYDNMQIRSFLDPLQNDTVCFNQGMKNCIPVKKPNNIIGIQGHVWTETIRTPEHLETMLYPRLLALAERAWHRASWEPLQEKLIRERMALDDWETFANRLGHKELARLEARDIKYYLPPPGAIYKEGRIDSNCAFPGLAVQVSTDNGLTWHDLETQQQPKLTGNVLLATRSHDRKRRGRSILLKVS